MAQVEIKMIKAHETLDLRQRILRPGKEKAAAAYPDDSAFHAFHLAAYIEGKIGCVATFLKEDHPAFTKTNQYRLRGMATDNLFRGQGLGRAVLEAAFTRLRAKDCHFIWCYAREVAFDFYVKVNFLFEGEFFEIPEIGPHKVMYREI